MAACVAFAALLFGAAAVIAPSQAHAEDDSLHIVYCYDGLAEDFSLDIYQHVKLPEPPTHGGYAELNERIEGWYVLTEDVTYDEPIFIEGDVHLILKDGCTLTANQGIVVGDGSSFSIYGNSTDEELMGSLEATGSANGWAGIGGGSWRSDVAHARSGNITINGGNVFAASTGGGAGIGGGVMGWPACFNTFERRHAPLP